jgi:hypothetical protein
MQSTEAPGLPSFAEPDAPSGLHRRGLDCRMGGLQALPQGLVPGAGKPGARLALEGAQVGANPHRLARASRAISRTVSRSSGGLAFPSATTHTFASTSVSTLPRSVEAHAVRFGLPAAGHLEALVEQQEASGTISLRVAEHGGRKALQKAPS